MSNFIKLILIAVILTVSSQVFAQNTQKINAGYVFKLKPKVENVKHCAKVNGKWKGVKRYSNGQVSIIKNKAANKACKQKGRKFSSGGASFKIETAPRQTLSRTTSSAPFIRIGSDGTRYTTYVGAEYGATVFFELANGLTIFEPASKPTTIGGTISCYYGLILSDGSINCLSNVGNIFTFEGTGVNGYLVTDSFFQNDSSNNTYFLGTDFTEPELSATNLYKIDSSGNLNIVWVSPDDSATLVRFLTGFSLISDNRVVVTGELTNISTGDKAPFIELISASEIASEVEADTRDITGYNLSFVKKLPDGQPYFGLTNYRGDGTSDPSDTALIAKLNSLGSGLDFFLGDNTFTPSLSTNTFCEGVSAESSFCDYQGTMITSGYSTSTTFYAITQEQGLGPISSNRVLMKYYPSIEVVSLSNITIPRFVSGFGNNLYISGKDSSGNDTIVEYNTDTASESVVSTGINLAFPLRYSARTSSLIGYGTNSDLDIAIIIIPIVEGAIGSARVVTLTDAPSAITLSF